MGTNIRRLLALSGATLLATSLAACSAGEASDGGGDSPVETLNVLSFGLDRAPDIFDAFTEETGIEVVVEQVGTGDFPAVLQARVAAKADIDVINYRSGAESNKYAAAGTFMDITGDPLLENVAPGGVEAGAFEGKNYGIAAGAYVVGVYYNEDLFDELGLSIPTNWDEFMETAQAIKDGGNGVAPLVLSSAEGWTNQYVYHGAVAKFAADNTSFMGDLHTGDATWSENTLFAKQVERYKEIAERGFFLPGGESLKFGDGQAAFASGKAAMWMMGSWGLGGLEPAGFTPGAFALPFNDSGEEAAVASSLFDNVFAVTSWSEKQDAALKLLTHMSTSEFGAEFQAAQGQKSASLNVTGAEYSPYQADWDALFDAALPYPFDIGPSVNGEGPGLLTGLLQGGDPAAVVGGFQQLQDADNELGY